MRTKLLYWQRASNMLDYKKIKYWPIPPEAKLGVLRYEKRLLENDLPIIYNLPTLSYQSGFNESFIRKAAYNNQSLYRTFKIPKRRGEFRSITTPSPSLLSLHRWILIKILYKLPSHQTCHSFKRGASIVSNASAHLSNKYMYKFDIKEFFPSIKIDMVIKLFLKFGYAPNVSKLLALICTSNGTLPQGGPCSPYISNLVLYDFDQHVSNFCSKRAVYTRYADDITISSAEPFEIVADLVKSALNAKSFVLRDDKTRFLGPDDVKFVTGIGINGSNLSVPNRIKQEIRHQVYYINKFGIEEHISHMIRSGHDVYAIYKSLFRLSGLLSYIYSVEGRNEEYYAASSRISEWLSPLAVTSVASEDEGHTPNAPPPSSP